MNIYNLSLTYVYSPTKLQNSLIEEQKLARKLKHIFSLKGWVMKDYNTTNRDKLVKRVFHIFQGGWLVPWVAESMGHAQKNVAI